MDKNTICNKCGGPMSKGFILDMDNTGSSQSKWLEGEPELSFWTGIKYIWETKYLIETYRCEKCGYLESYAKEKAE